MLRKFNTESKFYRLVLFVLAYNSNMYVIGFVKRGLIPIIINTNLLPCISRMHSASSTKFSTRMDTMDEYNGYILQWLAS